MWEESDLEIGGGDLSFFNSINPILHLTSFMYGYRMRVENMYSMYGTVHIRMKESASLFHAQPDSLLPNCAFHFCIACTEDNSFVNGNQAQKSMWTGFETHCRRYIS